VTNSNVTFIDCNFTENYALLGGGGGINWFGSREPNVTKPTNHYEVIRCKFERNEAQIGSAMVISKEFFESIPGGILSAMVIDNCSFINNNNNQQPTKTNPTHYTASGIGAIVATGFGLQFKGCTLFLANNSTAVVGDESVIEFYHNSTVTFSQNKGTKGGAILLVEGAFLRLLPNSMLTFFENFAILYGGAIFVDMETPYEYVQSHICFMRYYKENISPTQWNVTLKFTNNTSFTNNTIFSSTLQPCFKEYSSVALFQDKFFIFEPPFANSTVATFPSKFKVSMSVISVSPGKVFNLPIQLIDELNHNVPVFVLIATCKNHGQGAYVLSPYQYSNGSMQIAGDPTETCSLELKTDSNHPISTTIRVNLSLCPPGYYYSKASKQCECITTHLHGNIVFRCNISQFEAYVSPAFWVGYTPVTADNANETIVGPCPFGYCYGPHLTLTVVPLPKDANRTLLNSIACGAAHRTGTLCGSCIDGHAVVMNSPTFSCHDCRKKHYGVFLFLLYYVLPVTVLFFVAMHCKRITYGWFSAFLFFSQIISSQYHLDFNYALNVDSSATLSISSALLTVYGISNLNFFQHDVFSYCLFANAGTVDILASNVFLSLYPLLLIAVYFLVRRYCVAKCRCQLKCFTLLFNSSVTHGIGAFLVLCFAKLNSVFAILKSVGIYHISKPNAIYKSVVYLQGDIDFFENTTYNIYATGSILISLTVIAIPTIVLMLYPCISNIFIIFQWEESRVIQFVNKCLFIHKLKPILDSFQGDYKNHLQFFAGVYFFLYKTLFFCIVIAGSSPDVNALLLFLIMFFLIITSVHMLTMPYKMYKDNAAYSFVYMLLSIILFIEYFIFTSGKSSYTVTLLWIKLLLSALPLCGVLGYCNWWIVTKIRSCYEMKKTNYQLLPDFPDRMINENDDYDDD